MKGGWDYKWDLPGIGARHIQKSSMAVDVHPVYFAHLRSQMAGRHGDCPLLPQRVDPAHRQQQYGSSEA